jgi:hypothetical protein
VIAEIAAIARNRVVKRLLLITDITAHCFGQADMV